MQGIPTVQDYLENMVVQPWMNNGAKPLPSQEAKDAARELLERLREERETETV
jgi:glycerate-2-kinase